MSDETTERLIATLEQRLEDCQKELAEAKAEIERLKTCEIELINHRKAITAINRFCVKVKP